MENDNTIEFIEAIEVCGLKIVYIYSAGDGKSPYFPPYFLFHGETALRKILKFQGEAENFSEKIQGETGISWRKRGAL